MNETSIQCKEVSSASQLGIAKETMKMKMLMLDNTNAVLDAGQKNKKDKKIR